MARQTVCIYGKSGTGKTTEAVKVAVQQYVKTGYPARMASADGGGTSHFQDLIEAGFIDFLDIRHSPKPLGILGAIAKGGWLPYIEVDTQVPEVDPRTGQEVGTKTLHRRVLTPLGGVGNELLPDGSLPIGCYILEGITTFAVLILRHLVFTGQGVAQDVVGKIEEEGLLPDQVLEILASASKAHYGSTQNYIHNFITLSSGLPVDLVIYTAHPVKGRSDRNELKWGVGLVGTAGMDTLPQALGDLIYNVRYEEEVTVQGVDGEPAKRVKRTGIRAYLEPVADPEEQLIKWPATIRIGSFDPLSLLGEKSEEPVPLQMMRQWVKGLDKDGNKRAPLFLDLTRDGKGIADLLKFKEEHTKSSVDKLKEAKARIDEAWEKKRAEGSAYPGWVPNMPRLGVLSTGTGSGPGVGKPAAGSPALPKMPGKKPGSAMAGPKPAGAGPANGNETTTKEG